MIKEYGVACLLDKASADALKDCFPFLETNNRPHVSLFQFRSDDFAFINLMKHYVKNIKISSQFYTHEISLVENNIFLHIIDDLTLKSASNKIIELYESHCHYKEPLSQINLSELTTKQLALVESYGIYWVKRNFQPHITLRYGCNRGYDLRKKAPQSVRLLAPDMYFINPQGKII